MRAKEFDVVQLKDGTTGVILEVFPTSPETYLLEYPTPEGDTEYAQMEVTEDQIEKTTHSH